MTGQKRMGFRHSNDLHEHPTEQKNSLIDKKYEQFRDKLGVYEIESALSLFTISGALNNYHVNEEYVQLEFLPSIVSAGKKLKIDNESPVKAIIPRDTFLVMSPLKKGDLEKIVKEHNTQVDKDRI